MISKKEFIESHCPGCGSQRCDGSDEWIEGCTEYQKLVMGVCSPDYENLVREAKNEEKQGVLNMFKRWKEIITKKL